MQRVSVLIIGEDTDDPDNDWHKVAHFAKEQLENQYPNKVDFAYMPMETALNNMKATPAINSTAKVPVVMIDGEVFSQGRKISIPDISREVGARLH
ncbi:MAG: hypothetical protein FH749_05105 [Firmicutes bacterium]|nr:hypothetical protein [Bacillota bacterium]